MENENGKLGHVNRVATIYPIQFYNISTNTQNLTSNTQITKHILAPSAGSGQANNMDIATIQGSGADAKIYYNHSDLLQSSSVMTDQTGAIAETTDSYPFGEIRLDTHPSTGSGSSAFSEQRKFIGQEYDADTGLNYLNARYYNSALARFTSQDPMLFAAPEKLLEDPQQLNFYSYARNNPITASDPTGKYTEVSSKPIDIPGLSLFFAHTSTHVVPEPGENLYMDYNNKCVSVTEPITFGGYPVGTPFLSWQLTLMANEPGESLVYQNYLNGLSNKMGGVKVNAEREGMTNQQLDQNVINTISSIPVDQGYYNPGGTRRLTSFSNSNNTTTSVLLQSGVSYQQTSEIGMNLFSQNYKLKPGFGTPLTAQTYIQSATQRVSDALLSAVQTLTNVLENYNSGRK